MQFYLFRQKGVLGPLVHPSSFFLGGIPVEVFKINIIEALHQFNSFFSLSSRGKFPADKIFFLVSPITS
jgi:hypothetical protein